MKWILVAVLVAGVGVVMGAEPASKPTTRPAFESPRVAELILENQKLKREVESLRHELEQANYALNQATKSKEPIAKGSIRKGMTLREMTASLGQPDNTTDENGETIAAHWVVTDPFQTPLKYVDGRFRDGVLVGWTEHKLREDAPFPPGQRFSGQRK